MRDGDAGLEEVPDDSEIQRVRSRTQVASMAMDARRGYFVLVTTMLTAHVFRLHGVSLEQLQAVAHVGQRQGLLTARLPRLSDESIGKAAAPAITPVLAFRLGMQRGNVRVEVLPEPLRQPVGDAADDRADSSIQFVSYLPSGIVSVWSILPSPYPSEASAGAKASSCRLWLQGSYLVQAGQEPRELCSVDDGKVALAVLGKSYCTVLVPFRALGIRPAEVELASGQPWARCSVPAGSMRQASVLVELYKGGSGGRSQDSSSAAAGVVPPAAIVRLRRKDASLIHIRCAGSSAHVFLAESRATVFQAKGIRRVPSASSRLPLRSGADAQVDGPSVEMDDDARAGSAEEAGKGSGELHAKPGTAARILSWSLMQLSSEFNGEEPADATLEPW